MAGASFGRLPDPVARAARQVDANDVIQRAARAVARRIGGTKDRDHRSTDGGRKVHRAGVTRDQYVDALEHGRQREQIEMAGDVDHAFAWKALTNRIDE